MITFTLVAALVVGINYYDFRHKVTKNEPKMVKGLNLPGYNSPTK